MEKRLAALITLWLVSIFSVPGIARALEPMMESIAMETPEGYVRVDPSEFSEFVAALGSEVNFRNDTLLHVYVKEQEMPFLREGDFERLTATILAVRFQERLPSGISSGAMPNTTQVEQDMLQQSDRINILLGRKQTESMMHALSAQPCTKGVQQIDGTLAASWFESGSAACGTTRALGRLGHVNGFEVYALLQNNNTFLSYGLLAQHPVLVLMAIKRVKNMTLGLYFADIVSTPDQMADAASRATRHIARQTELFPERAPSLSKAEESFNLLSFAGRLWNRQQKFNKAENAIHREMAMADCLGLTRLRYSAAVELATCYVLQGDYVTLTTRIRDFVTEADKALGTDDTLVISLREMLGAGWRGMKQPDKAVAVYETALASSLKVHGPLGESTLDIQREYALSLLAVGEYVHGREMLVDAYVGATERGDLSRQQRFVLDLAHFDALSQPSWAVVFFQKIGASQAWYCHNGTDAGLIDKGDYSRAKAFLQFYLQKTHTAETPEQFNAAWNTANAPEDTPYNKARLWMNDKEQALYEEYAVAAPALTEAGRSGTEAEKMEARRAFRAWLESVECVLGHAATHQSGRIH